MKQWPLILLILIVQETVTLNGLLVKVHQGESSVWLITLIFMIITTVEIFIGYVAGVYAKERFNKGKVKVFADRWVRRFYAYIGKHGRRIYMILLGYFSFPYLNAFIMAWLNIPLIESFGYLFLGNMIFYLTSWLLVLGVMSVVPNPFAAFGAVIVLTILVTVAMRLYKARKI